MHVAQIKFSVSKIKVCIKQNYSKSCDIRLAKIVFHPI